MWFNIFHILAITTAELTTAVIQPITLFGHLETSSFQQTKNFNFSRFLVKKVPKFSEINIAGNIFNSYFVCKKILQFLLFFFLIFHWNCGQKLILSVINIGIFTNSYFLQFLSIFWNYWKFRILEFFKTFFYFFWNFSEKTLKFWIIQETDIFIS